METFESTVQGIPCQICITYAIDVPGDPRSWDSDMDFYGFRECEFDVLDRRGYPAPWLERKMTDRDRERIEEEVFAL